MRLLFVLNPAAGAGQKDWKTIVNNWCADKAYTHLLYSIQPDADNEGLISGHITAFKPEKVVAIGGDGTVKMVAGILVAQQVPLAIIPAGSANGMARELGLPIDTSKALEMVENGTVRLLDMIRINNEWCIHLSDVGLNAAMLRYFEQTPKRGMLGYARAVFKMIGHRTYMRVQIETDEVRISRNATMVVIANASKYGTGAVINPHGKPNDGLFELVIVHRLSLADLFKILLTQHAFDPAKIEILCCRHMTLTTSKPYPFQIDGEYRGRQQYITASIKAGAVQVILPDEAE